MSKKEERERKTKIQHWKVIAFYLVVYDIIAVNFSYFLGLWLRFDLQYSNIPREYLSAFLKLYRCGSHCLLYPAFIQQSVAVCQL